MKGHFLDDPTQRSIGMWRTIVLGLTAIALLSAGQTLLKLGLNDIGGITLSLHGSDLFKLLQTPWVIAGLICYVLSSVIWLDVLSRLDFSLAFPIMGLNYVFILLIGRFVFHEPIGATRILGVVLILAGLFVLLGSSTPSPLNVR